MNKKINAIKRVCVAFGYGSNISEYAGVTVEQVLKELAVKANCVSNVNEINARKIDEILNIIANNLETAKKTKAEKDDK